MSPEIELDLYEMTTAAQTGLLRVTESIKQNQEWWHGYKGTLEDKISKSISGAMAEISLCKYLGVPFEFHTNVGSAPDVKYKNYKIQVRSQTLKKNNNNSLIIRPKGVKPNEIYVFILSEAPKFTIKGFINSSAVMGKEDYLTDFNLARPKVWAVPLKILNPIILLKDESLN